MPPAPIEAPHEGQALSLVTTMISTEYTSAVAPGGGAFSVNVTSVRAVGCPFEGLM